MTLQTVQNFAIDLGDGSTKIFTVPFKFFRDTDLLVCVSDADGNDAAALTLNVDYTVTGAGEDNGGYISFAVAPVAGVKVVRLRNVLPLQDANFVENNGFPAATVEDILDGLTAAMQDVAARANRAMLVPLADGSAPGPLPSRASRAGKLAAYDANGNPIASNLTISEIEDPVAGAHAEALAAAASAVQAQNYAAALHGTSASSNAIGSGAKGFVTQAGKQWQVGDYVLVSDAADPTNYMHGKVASYAGTALVVTVSNIGGAGTKTNWTIALSGPSGPAASPAWGGIAGAISAQADLATELAKGKTGMIGVSFDGGGSAIPVGSFLDYFVPFTCTISQWLLAGTPSGNITIEVRKCSYTNYDGGATHPVTGDKINATVPPSLTGATKNTAANLVPAGWTVALTAGDVLRFYVTVAATVTRATLQFLVTKA